MIRFIHLSDVNLGAAPDRGCPWSHERKEEIWDTFRRVIAGIRKNPVDLLFISGDLFHRQPLLRELQEINTLFSSISDTRVFLMAGSNDYIKEDSFYKGFEWSENVTFFKDENRTCIKVPEINAYIYGLSYEHPEIKFPIYDDWKASSEEGFHVLLAYGGEPRYSPMDFAKIAEAGFDYVALGHSHNPHTVSKDKMAYSGSLEPLERSDLGPHGYIEGEYDEGSVRLRLRPFALRSYQTLVLTLDHSSTQYTLEDMLRSEVMRRGGRNIYSLILKGRRKPGNVLLLERFHGLGNIIEIIDESMPDYDIDALYKRYRGTLIGDYIESFRGRELTYVEAKALYYGIQALMNEKVLVDGRKHV